jgi:hypothetical protein
MADWLENGGASGLPSCISNMVNRSKTPVSNATTAPPGTNGPSNPSLKPANLGAITWYFR